MSIKPEICVLKTDGINCEEEMAHAFTVSGASVQIIHVNELRDGSKRLENSQVLGLPGGFSHGDDVAAGKILAVELTSRLSDQIQRFVDAKKPILGVCNGFQALVRTGLLPNRTLGEQQATLAHNEIGHLVCRWVDLAPLLSTCQFFQPEDFDEATFPIQTAHGEGNYISPPGDMSDLIENGQLVFQYANPNNLSQLAIYPHNPNGSEYGIAGICDPSGLILGMMPHPERSITAFHPHRIRTEVARNAANVIFNNIVNYAKEM